MKLIASLTSPFARKVRIVLIEKGLAFESDITDGGRPIEAAPAPTLARSPMVAAVRSRR